MDKREKEKSIELITDFEPQEVKSKRQSEIANPTFGLVMWLIACSGFVLQVLFNRDYILGFWGDPVGKIAIVASIFWATIGGFLLSKYPLRNRALGSFVTMILVVVFVVPPLVVPMLGPAVLTILRALH